VAEFDMMLKNLKEDRRLQGPPGPGPDGGGNGSEVRARIEATSRGGYRSVARSRWIAV